MKVRLFSITLLLFISACSTLEPTTTIEWQAHQDAVLSHANWQLRGRLNVRTSDDSNTVAINWQQAEQQFLINLSSSVLGLGATQIEGNRQQVTIDKSGEDPIIASTLEEVSSYYLGYEFPASALNYWVRGIPAPEGRNPSGLVLNETQLLKHLNQTDNQRNEWQLEYDRYELVNGIFLPGRIKMQHPSYRLTFIITEWQLTSDIAPN